MGNCFDDARLSERELALDTIVTQAYNAVWYPSAAGQVVRKEIKTAGGESGASVVAEIRRLLQDEGELITAEHATTREALLSLGKLFFDTSQTPTLDALREHFACTRSWPVLVVKERRRLNGANPPSLAATDT